MTTTMAMTKRKRRLSTTVMASYNVLVFLVLSLFLLFAATPSAVNASHSESNNSTGTTNDGITGDDINNNDGDSSMDGNDSPDEIPTLKNNPRASTLVQCYLDPQSKEPIIFDSLLKTFRKPPPTAQPNRPVPSASHASSSGGVIATTGNNATSSVQNWTLKETESIIYVKECWCSRVLNRKSEFCSADFDTCQVKGTHGSIVCFSNETKINVIRGIWPFCLFWVFALVYMWVASEPGRRARGFVKRHAINCYWKCYHIHERNIQQLQQRTQQNNDDESDATPMLVLATGNYAGDADDNGEPPMLVFASSSSSNHHNDTAGGENNDGGGSGNDIEAPGSPSTSPLDSSVSGEDAAQGDVALDDEDVRNSAPVLSEQLGRNAHADLPMAVAAAAAANTTGTDNAADDDDDDIASLRSDATHVTLRGVDDTDNENEGQQLTYPLQFRSRSNYLQLLQELCHMYRYEPDRLAQLWHTAWLQERRRELRVIQRQVQTQQRRQRQQGHINNGEENLASNGDDNPNFLFPPSLFLGVGTGTTTGPETVDVDYSSNDRHHSRTVQLGLKTKRFKLSPQKPRKTASPAHLQATNTRVADDLAAAAGPPPPPPAGLHIFPEMTNADIGDNRDHNSSNKNVEQQGRSSNPEQGNDIQQPQVGDDDEEQSSCVICFVEFEDGDIIGDIPCQHLFHKDCLKTWLRRSNRCPLCQEEGIATPLSPHRGTSPMPSMAAAADDNDDNNDDNNARPGTISVERNGNLRIVSFAT